MAMPQEQPRTTLEQQRAAFAWKVAQDGVNRANDRYTKLAKSAPSLIMMSGLMQTLAFLQDKSKSKNELQHELLLEHVIKWLSDRFNNEVTNDTKCPFPTAGQKDLGLLMNALFHAKPEQFQRATAEAMAILRWIRQFAAALDKRQEG